MYTVGESLYLRFYIYTEIKMINYYEQYDILNSYINYRERYYFYLEP